MERFWGTRRLHLTHSVRLRIVQLRLHGMLDFDDDRDFVAAQRVVVQFLNAELSERVPGVVDLIIQGSDVLLIQ